jgi:hypothetical protein
VLPAPRVPDGLTISPSPFREQADSKAPTDLIPDNGIVERFHKTMLDEFYRIAFRKKRDDRGPPGRPRPLDARVQRGQAHQGKWCFGKAPMQTFLDALPLAREKSVQVTAAEHPNAA